MAIIYVFNDIDGGIEKYNRTPNDPMPYNIGGTLSVLEFMGTNTVGWTDTNTMNAWNTFRSFYGRPVRVDTGYVKVTQPTAPLVKTVQQFMGTAFAVGSNLSDSGRQELYDAAVESNAFSVVQPFKSNERSVYFDCRYLPSGYFVTYGLPVTARGKKGNYVFTIQDILVASGYSPGSVDGIYGVRTESAIKAFQRQKYLTENGSVDLIEWQSLLNISGPIN